MDKLIEELTYFAYEGERDFFDITRSEAKSFLNELGKKDDEIERLNNNWNELEKFICDLEIECIIDSSMWGVAVIIHNKLKELKGSDKE